MSLPRATLKPRRALPFFNRHPWVFSGAIGRVEGSPQPGDEIELCSAEGEFIARGLYNSNSNIQLRLYSWKPDEALDEAFWRQRLQAAIDVRRRLFEQWTDRTAFRLVFSEADGLSGLIVDRYGDWLVVQFTSLALAARQELFVKLLQELLRPAGIWLRTEKGIGDLEGLELADGLVAGAEPPRPQFIEEQGMRFGVDLTQGQKTGFYLDQRDNRAAAARYMRGARVLDAFCYSGGFGIAALVLGQAREVIACDVSEAALTLARANADLNGVADRVKFEQGDLFERLAQFGAAGQQFDAVILDPPKMTRHRSGLSQALRAHQTLNELGVALLKPGGTLVTCCCSGLIGRADFELMLANVATGADRRIRILESRGAAADHPTSAQCLETNYLQCHICHVE